jgi:ribosome modulation factor
MARKKKGETQPHEGGPGIGDNFKKRVLSEDEQRVLIYSFKAKVAQHDKEIAEAQSVLTKAKAAKKATFELAKSEYGPNAKSDIEELLLLEQPKSGEALQADIERKLKLARWAGQSVGFQSSMFEPDRRPATERAREDGKTAALAGEPCKAPYDPSVPQYQQWMEGWHQGVAVWAAMLGPKDAQMDLAERDDLPPEGQPSTADVSNPPFNPTDAGQAATE